MKIIKKYLVTILISLLISSIVYFAGAIFNTSLNLNDFTKESRISISIISSILFIVCFFLVFFNYDDFTK